MTSQLTSGDGDEDVTRCGVRERVAEIEQPAVPVVMSSQNSKKTHQKTSSAPLKIIFNTDDVTGVVNTATNEQQQQQQHQQRDRSYSEVITTTTTTTSADTADATAVASVRDYVDKINKGNSLQRGHSLVDDDVELVAQINSNNSNNKSLYVVRENGDGQDDYDGVFDGDVGDGYNEKVHMSQNLLFAIRKVIRKVSVRNVYFPNN